MKINNKLKEISKILIGITILILLIYKLDFNKIINTIVNVNISAIILFIVHYFVTMVINTLALSKITKAIDMDIKFNNLLKYQLLSYSIGRFTPARIGEFSLVHFLSKKNPIKDTYGKTAAIVLTYKLITIIALVIFSIWGFFIFIPANAIVLSISLIGIICLIIFLILSKNIREIIKKYILKKKSLKLKYFSKTIFYLITKKKMTLMISFLIILMRIFLTAYIIKLIFETFGINIPIITIIIINALGLIITMLPISFSGLGLKEAATVILYLKMGVNAVITGSIYLLLTFFHFSISGIIILWFTYITKKQ